MSSDRRAAPVLVDLNYAENDTRCLGVMHVVQRSGRDILIGIAEANADENYESNSRF